MTPSQRLLLWNRINDYTEACGGDTSIATVGGRRMEAVAAVESAVDLLLPPPSPPPAPLKRAIVYIDSIYIGEAPPYANAWEVHVRDATKPSGVDTELFVIIQTDKGWRVETKVPTEHWGTFTDLGDAFMQILDPTPEPETPDMRYERP